jgi:hypothetical protein
MNITDLSHDERLALVALTELAVISDRNITANEVDKVDEIVDALGEDTFQDLADEAESRFADRNILKNFLDGITRQEARELIYGTVLSGSLADTIPHEQSQFLESLAANWNITLEVEPNTTGN